ncbi:HDOD domain-containing protein [Pseudorhodoferax sp.]|uniref:HDOD domain-containing protein n=1 Tax=Pseudorhodoferax sp. TaxID=1993553 RepID=UPI002DD65609|nr:HDOD domain-containing protein [Pseudorhodoferax sp.]
MLEGLIVVVLALGALALWWLLRRGAAVPPPTATARRAAAVPRPAVPAAPIAPATPERTEAVLADDGRLARHETLAAERRQALLEALRQMPRPPRALHQLVSPEFVARASSTELAELVMTEPVVAARVMAAVNSPLYGLRTAVTSVGQAITFLGLNTVRNLCLQHLLREAMPAPDPALRQEFDILWSSSAIASELSLVLAKRLQLADAAGMSTQLVLHFLGRFAAATLLHTQADPAAPLPTALQPRALAEQQRLGLSAGEIGSLLLQDWGLPAPMEAPTRAIARIAFAVPTTPGSATRPALAALCASLAERIARRQLTALQDYAPEQDPHEDLQALRPHLPDPVLAAVGEALREPDMARVLA